MKKIVFVLIMMSAFNVFAQPKDPVTWKFEARKKTDGSFDVVATATVQKPWHIYSQYTGSGPIPTKLSFKVSPLITLQGKVNEVGKLEKVYDPNFKSEVLFFSNTVSFVQNIKLKGKAKTNISGIVEYMVCDDEQCLPPTKKSFDISLQ